jgi:hypothetical protein
LGSDVLRMSRKRFSRTLLFGLCLLVICAFSLVYSVSLGPLDRGVWLRAINGCSRNATLIVLGYAVLILLDNLWGFRLVGVSFVLDDLGIIPFGLEINTGGTVLDSYHTFFGFRPFDKLQLSCSIFFSLYFAARAGLRFGGAKLCLRADAFPLSSRFIATNHSLHFLISPYYCSRVIPDDFFNFCLIIKQGGALGVILYVFGGGSHVIGPCNLHCSLLRSLLFFD